MKLLFSSPAFQRYELSEIVFKQRKWAIDKLAAAGIEAQQVVIADDDNLDIATSFGFDTVERDNEWLGRRFNDGYQHGYEEGYTHVFPIGSDSWCDPQFIIDAVKKSEAAESTGDPKIMRNAYIYDGDVIASRHYTRINTTGTVRRQIWVPVLQGVSYLLPVVALEQTDYRPCQEDIPRGCDGSTWQRVNRATNVKVRAVFHESNIFETTSFESWPQITAFDKLGGRWGRGDTKGEAVFSDLCDIYTFEHVEKIVAFYAARRESTMETESESQDIERRVKEITSRVLSTPKVSTLVRQKSRPYIEQAVRIALTERG